MEGRPKCVAAFLLPAVYLPRGFLNSRAFSSCAVLRILAASAVTPARLPAALPASCGSANLAVKPRFYVYLHSDKALSVSAVQPHNKQANGLCSSFQLALCRLYRLNQASHAQGSLACMLIRWKRLSASLVPSPSFMTKQVVPIVMDSSRSPSPICRMTKLILM